MAKQKMVSVTYSLHPTTEEYVETLAKELGKSKSWVARRAIFLLKEQYGGER